MTLFLLGLVLGGCTGWCVTLGYFAGKRDRGLSEAERIVIRGAYRQAMGEPYRVNPLHGVWK